MEDRVEKCLALSLAKLSSLAIPMNRSDVMNYVRILLQKPMSWQGAKWFSGFLKRQSNILSERKVRQVTKVRLKYDFIVPVNKFIKKYENLRTKIIDHPEVVVINGG